MYFTWVPEGARCTGSLLHVFLCVICTRCYEMRVFYVGPEGARCTGTLLHVSFPVICTRCYEMHVFYVGPGRSAVHEGCTLGDLLQSRRCAYLWYTCSLGPSIPVSQELSKR